MDLQSDVVPEAVEKSILGVTHVSTGHRIFVTVSRGRVGEMVVELHRTKQRREDPLLSRQS
jgi:hypothetical protein